MFRRRDVEPSEATEPPAAVEAAPDTDVPAAVREPDEGVAAVDGATGAPAPTAASEPAAVAVDEGEEGARAEAPAAPAAEAAPEPEAEPEPAEGGPGERPEDAQEQPESDEEEVAEPRLGAPEAPSVREPVPRATYPPPRAVPAPPPRPREPAGPRRPAQPSRGARVTTIAPQQARPVEWNLWDLERLAREQSRSSPERAQEWSYLFVYLRQFASPGGTLPSEFDPLVRESFGTLLGRVARA